MEFGIISTNAVFLLRNRNAIHREKNGFKQKKIELFSHMYLKVHVLNSRSDDRELTKSFDYEMIIFFLNTRHVFLISKIMLIC